MRLKKNGYYDRLLERTRQAVKLHDLADEFNESPQETLIGIDYVNAKMRSINDE